jgi:hypothetical protein
MSGNHTLHEPRDLNFNVRVHQYSSNIPHKTTANSRMIKRTMVVTTAGIMVFFQILECNPHI